MSLTRNAISYAVPGLAALALSGLAVSPAAAQTLITFDDVTNNGSGSPLPAGYQGLNWTLSVLNTQLYSINPSGYQAGTISGPNVIYGGGSITAPVGMSFTLSSGYFTAAWDDNLALTATGLQNGVTTFTKSVLLSATAPTLINFDFLNVDQVTFSATGGTQHAAYAGTGNQFAADNLTFRDLPTPASAAPEPSQAAALGLTTLGVLGLVLRARRKKPTLS